MFQIDKFLIIKGVVTICKIFEDKMMEIIHHSVGVCVDNVNGLKNINKVFVMLWKEKTTSSMMYDYEIDGKLVRRHEPSKYAASMVLTTFDELQSDLEKLESLFNENKYKFPTAFQMIYYPQTNNFKMKIQYDQITEKTGEAILNYYEDWILSKIEL